MSKTVKFGQLLVDENNKKGNFYQVTDTDLDGKGPTIILEHVAEQIPYNVSRDYMYYYNAYAINDNLGKVLDLLTKQDILIITDVSCNEELAVRIDDMVKEGYVIQLLDHHASALWMNKYDWAHVVIEKDGILTCGTELFYDFIQSFNIQTTPFIKEVVEYIRLYDTWDWFNKKSEQIEAKQLNDLFSIYKGNFFADWLLNLAKIQEHFAFDETATNRLAIEEEIIQEAFKDANKNLYKKKVVINGQSYQVGVSYINFKGSYASEIGNRLNTENKELDFIVLITVNSKRISMRSIHKHIHLDEICGLFGGGGHPPASGCSLTKELLDLFSVFDEESEITAIVEENQLKK